MSRGIAGPLRQALAAESRLRQRAVDAVDEAAAVHLGVNRTDLRCLDVLVERERATPGQLAEALGLTSGSVTTMLDRLQRAGYVRRTPDASDRRRVHVAPTPALLQAAASLYGPIASAGATLLRRYTAEEQAARFRSMAPARDRRQLAGRRGTRGKSR